MPRKCVYEYSKSVYTIYCWRTTPLVMVNNCIILGIHIVNNIYCNIQRKMSTFVSQQFDLDTYNGRSFGAYLLENSRTWMSRREINKLNNNIINFCHWSDYNNRELVVHSVHTAVGAYCYVASSFIHLRHYVFFLALTIRLTFKFRISD